MKQIFVLGGTGFIGQTLVKEAVAAGWRVKALARSEQGADQLRQSGAKPVTGDALAAHAWVCHAREADVIIDLVQPTLPDRPGCRAMKNIAAFRLRSAASLLAALQTIPNESRPLLISVSGTDDLLPDSDGRIHADSPLREKSSGFGQIGIPVRQLVEQSGIAASYAYLAHVYGAGKFLQKAVPAIALRKFPVIGRGDNILPMIHVEDAAQALLHIAGQEKPMVAWKNFIVADRSHVTLDKFINTVAYAIHAPAPKHIPRWLATVVIGKAMVSEMTSNVIADPAALLESGFRFRYPSLDVGLPPALAALGLSDDIAGETTHV